MNPANVSPQTAFKVPPASADKKDMKLRKACADFEAIMLRQLLAAMRASVPQSGLLDGGDAAKMYQDMQDEQLASTLAHGKGVGFGEALYRQLSRKISTRT
ncbi:MAG: rod-binding protein [Desulfobacteraceae bacterium]|nr:rod-binding protein [Desulfobacteraceae bacterium]